MKTVCITGCTGQTGSYLCERLLNDYKVYGLMRKSSSFNTERINHIFNHPNLELMYGDLTDGSNITNWIAKCKPDYFFNLGALSHVKVSFDQPLYTLNADAGGVINCLEAIRLHSPNTRFLHAGTSEQFGSSSPPQSEKTEMAPQSPYGVSKLAAYWLVRNYREGYGLFACSSISFNHESKKRSPTFVTGKICRGAARIKCGLQNELVLGNLKAKRSWNHVSDIIDGMLLMINAEKPDDYVIGSNKMISVEEFAEKVFSKLGMDWKDYVKVSEKYFRPNEVPNLEPDSTKIRTELGWTPKYSLDDIINEMLDEHMRLAKQEVLLKEEKLDER